VRAGSKNGDCAAAEILIESGDIYIGAKNIDVGSDVVFWGWEVNLPAASRGASAAQLETNLRRLMPREALA